MVGDIGHLLEQRGDKGRGGRHESSVTDHLLLVPAEDGQVKVGDAPVQLASRPVLAWTHKLGLDSHYSGPIKSSASLQLNPNIFVYAFVLVVAKKKVKVFADLRVQLKAST